MRVNRLTRGAFAAIAVLGISSSASAQEPGADIEVPVLIMDFGEGAEVAQDDDLDLANIVQTAAKGVTTVQEAPAIVTVITEDDIRKRGITRLDDALDTVPGWLRLVSYYGSFPYAQTRGTAQSTLYMQNGVSLFDPAYNIPTLGRIVPVELIERVEVVTGPGGVLWGANSYLGVLNMVTKDGTDVDGVEAEIRYGDGPGASDVMRGYVMAGLPELFGDDDASLMLHASFDSYIGQQVELPQHLFSTPVPQPNALAVYGPLTASDQARSQVFQVNGRLDVGELEVIWHAPITVEHHTPGGFTGVVTQQTLPDDSATNPAGEPMCPQVESHLADGQRNPASFDSADGCVDRARVGRDNRADFYERYVLAKYSHANDAGSTLDVRAYGTQFIRAFPQLALSAPSGLIEGGLSFGFDLKAYRVGMNVDGQMSFGRYTRVLYGAEAFREWIGDNTETSRQGAGIESRFIGPSDLGRLAVPCPREPAPEGGGQTRIVRDCPLTFIFESDRVVLGSYVNPQFRYKKLILDAGVRAQAAPDALGEGSYPLQFILSGTAVYNLANGWHAKLNYSEGFRSPVFNNTDSNGEGIQIEGSRDLEIETSQSIQYEVNARLFKGKRNLREVNFRADYSYTKLVNLIHVANGFYENFGDRGLHSAEFLGNVHLKGGHQVGLAYTFLRIHTADRGTQVAIPEHWFHLSGVFNLIPDRLQAYSNFKVVGAKEDANRLVEHRTVSEFGQQISVNPHELALDRLPPASVVSAGLTWMRAFEISGLTARLYAYNAFNTRYYYGDNYGNYEPRLEFVPNPAPDFSFISSLNYRY